MFRESLKENLKAIFDLKKVTFDQVGESLEQECIFIEIDNSVNAIQEYKETAKVNGRLRIFASQDKLPYGYFQKKIQSAPTEYTKDLFFYDIEGNTNIQNNIVERTMSFQYLFTSQHDPNLGTITSIELSEG